MMYDRTLIQIRERSFLDLLDLAMLVVRDRPLVLGLAALVGIAPFAALNVWLLSDPDFPLVFWIVLLVLETPWATAPLSLVLGDLMFDARLRIGRMARTFLFSLPAFLVLQLLLRGLLLVFVVAYPFMPAQYAFLDEVILLERVGLLEALGRSRTISQGVRGRALHALARTDFSGDDLRALLLDVRRTLIRALVGDELHLVSPRTERSERAAVSGGRLDRDRVLRGLSLPRLHRSADPAGGLGAGAAAQGRRPLAGGETRLTLAYAIVLGLLYLGRIVAGEAAERAAPARPIERARMLAQTERAAPDDASDAPVRQALRGSLSVV